jgi:hypothetical protein
MGQIEDAIKNYKKRMDELEKSRTDARKKRDSITQRQKTRPNSLAKTQKVHYLLPEPPTHSIKIPDYNWPLVPTHPVKNKSRSKSLSPTTKELMLIDEFDSTPRGKSKSPKSKSNKGGKTLKRRRKI